VRFAKKISPRFPPGHPDDPVYSQHAKQFADQIQALAYLACVQPDRLQGATASSAPELSVPLLLVVANRLYFHNQTRINPKNKQMTAAEVGCVFAAMMFGDIDMLQNRTLFSRRQSPLSAPLCYQNETRSSAVLHNCSIQLFLHRKGNSAGLGWLCVQFCMPAKSAEKRNLRETAGRREPFRIRL
jgi:hypothetical protein